jgi:hypothetical protein
MVAYCVRKNCILLANYCIKFGCQLDRQTTTGLILHTARVGCSTFHPTAASRAVVEVAISFDCAPNLTTLSVNKSDNDKVHCEQLTNTNTHTNT